MSRLVRSSPRSSRDKVLAEMITVVDCEQPRGDAFLMAKFECGANPHAIAVRQVAQPQLVPHSTVRAPNGAVCSSHVAWPQRVQTTGCDASGTPTCPSYRCTSRRARVHGLSKVGSTPSRATLTSSSPRLPVGISRERIPASTSACSNCSCSAHPPFGKWLARHIEDFAPLGLWLAGRGSNRVPKDLDFFRRTARPPCVLRDFSHDAGFRRKNARIS